MNKNKEETSLVLVDKRGFSVGAEGGIRTHVGVNPNGFQDRLVMTTSIPLHFLML